MLPVRVLIGVIIGACLLAGGVVAIGEISKETGRIGPESRIQPSGRQLKPAGRLSAGLGNFSTGGALSTNGRFLFTLSAGRGPNDIRVVQISSAKKCRKGKRGSRCRRARAKKTGRVVQTLPMPGLSGGIAMGPDNNTMYVSGIAESKHKDQKVGDDVPGKQGDVVHVLSYSGRSGQIKREGAIEIPLAPGAPVVQDFPPSTSRKVNYPSDIGISRDGRKLVVALNLSDSAAIIDTRTKKVDFVKVGLYPKGAAVSRDGRYGLVSNEVDGTVSVIDLEALRVVKEIAVGPHLSHPQAIVVDPKRDRAYVAVTHQDLVAVLDLKKLEVERTLSVSRPEGLGVGPVALSVTKDGRRLLVSNSGDDSVAVFALPQKGTDYTSASSAKARAARRQAERVLAREGRKQIDLADTAREEGAELLGEEAEERAEAAAKKKPAVPVAKEYELIGRIPVGSYPTGAFATPGSRKLVWLSGKGLGVGPNPRGPNPTSKSDTDDAQGKFQYLPSEIRGRAGILAFPTDKRIRSYDKRADSQIRPINDMKAPPGTPITAPTADAKIKHVFYIVRENRTYDQVLGDDPRGDGDPKLTLFGPDITPNAHALAKRFPLLDHVYANSEASIDGHFWTSAAAVSDYVVRAWQQNYGGRGRPYDFGVYAVTWPSRRFLFDQAEAQGISWFNFGEAIAGVVPLPDRSADAKDQEAIQAKLAKSDLGQNGCFPNDASSGGYDVVAAAAGARIEVYDSSLPQGAPPNSQSRFECFQARFNQWVATNSVPQFVYATFANDHTAGTKPGERTPQAMVAENDLALGEVVDLISKSPIWKDSLILVIEDDSQNGADHVDAHRIPAFAISPYAKKEAVIHTRYDFLSFIRTLEIVIGMKPLNLFDAIAVPMYDVFTENPDNAAPYDLIVPKQSLTERNTESSPGARLSKAARIGDKTDGTPQRLLDMVLWKAVHGADAIPPPPGPNASALDDEAMRRMGLRLDGTGKVKRAFPPQR